MEEQPDPILAFTKLIPQTAEDKVNLLFKHQFSQIQVNLKSSQDGSVTIDDHTLIESVELLGVAETGYVAYCIKPDGTVSFTSDSLKPVTQADGSVIYTGYPMPINYIAEMFCDRMAACKIYLGDKYTDASPYEYLQKGLPDPMFHPDTLAELQKMMLILKDQGEDAAFQYIRERLNSRKS